jgi:hypothetical protein
VSPAYALDIRPRLLQAVTEIPVHALWLRLSAFAYNRFEDYMLQAGITAAILRGDAP